MRNKLASLILPIVRMALVAVVLLLQGCAALQEQREPPVASSAIPPATTTELGRLVPEELASSGLSAFRPLAFSAYALDARLTLIRHAQRSIDMQYYLLQDDATGRMVLREVAEAARRGIRVRLLLDDLYTAGSDRLLSDVAAFPNIELRLFNPFPAQQASRR